MEFLCTGEFVSTETTTSPAQNAIESFSMDPHHSHVHTAITTTQLEFSGTVSISMGQIGQISLGLWHLMER